MGGSRGAGFMITRTRGNRWRGSSESSPQRHRDAEKNQADDLGFLCVSVVGFDLCESAEGNREFMTFQNILLEKKNAIAYVTVNRPKVLNALNMATMEELGVAFQEIKHDSSVRVAILTGAGEKAFIAGADIGELAKQDALSGKEYAHRGQAVLDLIENLGKPAIACINGFALGGGCELALACTMRLASDNAKLGQTEVKLGIIPGSGGCPRAL